MHHNVSLIQLYYLKVRMIKEDCAIGKEPMRHSSFIFTIYKNVKKRKLLFHVCGSCFFTGRDSIYYQQQDKQAHYAA